MKSLLKTALLAGSALVAGLAPALAERTVRVAYYLNPTHVYIENAVEPFTKEVTEATNGSLVFEHYPSEQLGKAGDSVRNVQSGIADIAWITFTYHAQEMPASQVINLPLGLDGVTAAAMLWRATHQPGVIKDEWDRLGLVPLMMFANPPYEIHSTDVPLPDLASLKGLKLRSPGAAYVETVKRMGAIPYEVATPEQYEAMQRGLINSTIYAFSSWKSFRLSELVNHTTVGNNVVTTGLALVTTPRFMESLSPEERAAIDELGRKYSAIGTERAAELNVEALEEYKAGGLEVYEWSADDKKALVDLLQGVTEEWSANAKDSGIDTEALFGQITAFREDYETSGTPFPDLK